MTAAQRTSAAGGRYDRRRCPPQPRRARTARRPIAAPTRQPAEPAEKPAPPAVTRLVLVRHAVTAQTGPLLSGRAPGHRPVRRGAAAGRRARRAPRRRCRSPRCTRARSSARRRPPRRSPPTTGSRCSALARRHRGRLRRVDRREDRRPRQDRPVEDGAARAVAGPVPRRRVDWPRCRPAWSPRSRRSSPTTRATSSWWSRTPTRSRPRSRTTRACTSTCSSASSCRPRR